MPGSIQRVNKALRQTILDHCVGTASRDYDFDPTNGEPRIKAGDRLEYCPDSDTMKPLLAHIQAVYSRPSRLRLRCRASKTVLDVLNLRGVQQGKRARLASLENRYDRVQGPRPTRRGDRRLFSG
jgi:hypothetical protein